MKIPPLASVPMARNPFASSAEDERDRTFLQDRLRFLAKTLFLFDCGAWILGLPQYLLDPDKEITHAFISDMAAASHGHRLLAGGMWWLLARRTWSAPALRRLDFALTFGFLTLVSLAGGLDLEPVVLVAAPLLVLTMRAALIPGRGVWAAKVSCAAVVPAVVALGMIAHAEGRGIALASFRGAILCALGVVTAVVVTRVIHGLRERVVEARRLGQYQLTEKIGEGGMGEVWRAKHRMLARPAAVKLIRDVGSGSQTDDSRTAAGRFHLEAQVIATLTSPHTVSLYDFGVTDDGTLYYVMELLDGLDLDSLVKSHGPLPVARAAYLVRQACDSLAEAHAKGLVHRDIKPANLYACRVGVEHDYLKVLDFGLAKLLQPQEDLQLTRDGFTSGTPTFMAPEQAMGKDLDGRADVYALGGVLFWLVTGTTVFQGENGMKIILAHLNDPPSTLSDRLGEPVPKALEDIVAACLAKDPDERIVSAEELSRRLGSLQLDDSWNGERARAWWTANAA